MSKHTIWLILLYYRIKRHRHCSYEDIRDGQRGNEVVGGLSDLAVHGKADDDQEVPKCGDDDADGHADRDKHGQQHPERRGPAGRAAVLQGPPVTSHQTGLIPILL